MHIFDRLVEQDAQARLQPDARGILARGVEPTVWEFKLRAGVKWHDGRDFTADDVVFTIARVPNVREQPRQLRRLHPRHHARRGGGPADHPLPHRRAASAAADRTRLDPDHLAPRRREGARPRTTMPAAPRSAPGPTAWSPTAPATASSSRATTPIGAGAQPWARVSYRFVANDAARTAALLAGDVDLIDQVPSSDLARLRRDPRVSVHEIQGLRLIYLVPDFTRIEDPLVRHRQRRPAAAAQPVPRRARAPRAVDRDRPRGAGRARDGRHRARRPANGCRRASFGYNPDVPVPRPRPRRRAPPAGRGRLSRRASA